MIDKLKRKFVLVATTSVMIMLLVVVLGAGLFNYVDLDQKTDTMLLMIAENGGVLPKPDRKEKPPVPKDLPREALFDTRHFVVYLDENNQPLYADTGNIYSADAQKAQDYSLKVLDQNKKSGYLDDYKYLSTSIQGKNAIIFMDVSRDIDLLKGFIFNSSMISLGALVSMAVVSYLLSAIAIRPIIDAYQKQKQFITNASHEIKTPLTVISANLDIVEMHIGENKWIKSSKEQVIRLNDLVNSLVSLLRMEETEVLQKEAFSLSELCSMVAESYDSIAVSSEKTFEKDIGENITYLGNEQALGQLAYILLDNAFKYSDYRGKVFFSLSQKQGKILLTVENTVKEISPGKHNDFFDRFYREDQSRSSQTGGFGIGLSLAKSIVDKHKGKISAKSVDEKTLTITVIL